MCIQGLKSLFTLKSTLKQQANQMYECWVLSYMLMSFATDIADCAIVSL